MTLTAIATPELHETLAGLVSGLDWDDLPEPARAAAKDALVDFVGVAVAASREEVARACLEAAGSPSSEGECSVIGRPEKMAAPFAAMTNATLGHAFDYDDVYLPGAAHYSTVAIPAAMALAERAGADGKRFLAALVAGNEVGGRIALATRGEQGGIGIRLQGFFPTSGGGAVAGAAAASRALGDGTGRTAHALGLGMNFAGGLASIGHGDNNSKCLLAGWAAQAGVQAALFAHAGFTCQREVMESRRGYFNALAAGKFRGEPLTRPAGSPWIVEELSYKRYPVEYVIHPLVELAIQAREALGGRVAEIAGIEVSCYSGYALFDPPSLKHAPPDGYAAVFSAPYCIARALTRPESGHLTLSDFTDAYVCDAATATLASRVRFVPDAAYDRDFPHRVGARLKAVAADGAVLFEDGVPHPYGTPERPMSREQLIEKFHHNCRAWPAARRASVLEMLYRTDEAPDAGWISALR